MFGRQAYIQPAEWAALNPNTQAFMVSEAYTSQFGISAGQLTPQSKRVFNESSGGFRRQIVHGAQIITDASSSHKGTTVSRDPMSGTLNLILLTLML